MRSLFLMQLAGMITLSAFPIASDAQEARPYTRRTVITFPSTPEGQGSGAQNEPDRGRGAFRVHDLSRQWVEFQMERAFPEQEDPSAGERQSLPITVPPSTSIAVPPWMLGQDSPQSAALRYTLGCGGASYQPSGLLRPAEELRRQSYFALMSQIACAYGIPVSLFDAMIIQESRYDAAVFSPKQAFGLTQLMPGTATGLGVDRYNIEENLRGGAAYLRQQLDRFGAYHLALAAYNAGPGRVRNRQVPPFPETLDYVATILSNWTRLTGAQRRTTLIGEGAQSVRLGRSPSVSRF